MRIFILFCLLVLLLDACKVNQSIVVDGSKAVYPDFIDKETKLEEIYSGTRLFEAPVWDNLHKQLYFTGYEKGSEMLMRFVAKDKSEDVPLSKGTSGTFIDLT